MKQNKIQLIKLLSVVIFILVIILRLFSYNLIKFKYFHFFNINEICKYTTKKKFIQGCECSNSTSYDFKKISITSTCNDKASLKGPGQKVISYSLYLSESYQEDVFFGGIEDNLKDMREIYPGWLMRIYTDIEVNEKICSLLCKNDDLYWCNVHDIPSADRDLEDLQGMVWRILPIGDELVDKFLIRDLDSRHSLRELAAVKEWENSKFSFHVMRDHPQHTATVLGCCWGVDNLRIGRKRAKKFFHEFVMKGCRRGEAHIRDVDQDLFDEILYQKYQKEWLAHDSYLCEKYGSNGGEIRPFPTQRLPGPKFKFVGDCPRKACYFNKKEIGKCPLSCRPIGKNWDYC